MRIAWYVRKYMDVSLDTGTWVNMARELSGADQVRLVSGYRRVPKYFGDDVAIRYLPSIRVPGLNLITFSFSAIVDMFRAVRSRGVDIVIVDAYLVPAAILAATMGRFFCSGAKFVVDVRTLPIDTGRWRDRLDKALFSAALRAGASRLDGLTTITVPLAQMLANMTGVPLERIGVWTSGVDTSLYDPATCTRSAGQPGAARSGAEDEPLFMYHGALLTKRGVDKAIEAVAVLWERGVKARLLLVGGGLDAEYLAGLVEKLGLRHTVQIRPPVEQSDIPALICKADFGLIPFPDLECWRVSSPLKLLEYLSMETPVVATALACNTCVVGVVPYVEFAKTSEAGDLADAMMSAIQRSADMRAAASAGRLLVESEYTWAIQALRLRAYLESVLGPEGEGGSCV